MIFGKLEIGETALHTSNDSYAMDRLTAVTNRRPFLTAGLGLSVLTGAFGISFGDILTIGEIVTIAVISGGSALIGLTIGQLRLVSADLRGSPLAETVFGTYGHLNRLRPRILDAAHRAKTREGGR